MSRVGPLLKCRCIPPNLTFSTRGRRLLERLPRIHLSHPTRRRHLHSTTNRSYADSGSGKIDAAELARLLAQFEDSGDPERGKADGRTRRKGKSKIEDYDAWHGWDGESDRSTSVGSSEGKGSEVDRYIEGVLSGVAEAKAARERTAEEVAAVEEVEERAADEVLPGDDHGKDEIVADSAADTSAERSQPALSSPSVLASTIPAAAPSSSTPGKRPPFSKADMSLLAKKLQNRLDEEIRRLKMQKESVKQSLTLRAREFGKDAQVQFGLLGGKVNEVTGYSEIERLKQDVRERGEYVDHYASCWSNAEGSSQKTILHGLGRKPRKQRTHTTRP